MWKRKENRCFIVNLILNINNTRQFLNSVEKQVALFDHCLVLPVDAVRTVCFNDTSNSINLAMKTAGSYES